MYDTNLYPTIRLVRLIGFARPQCGPTVRKRPEAYFPMQNLLKMLPSRSSGVILPVISPR